MTMYNDPSLLVCFTSESYVFFRYGTNGERHFGSTQVRQIDYVKEMKLLFTTTKQNVHVRELVSLVVLKQHCHCKRGVEVLLLERREIREDNQNTKFC